MPYKILTSYELTKNNTYYVTVMVVESDVDLPRSVLPGSKSTYSSKNSVPELHLGPFNTPEDAQEAVKPVIISATELITKLRGRTVPKPETITI